MPLPEEQLDNLSKAVQSHERRVKELRDLIRLAEEEIAVHEVLIELAGNDKLMAMFSNCYDDPDSASQLARNPSEYLREQEVALPQELKLNLGTEKNSSDRLMGELRRGAWNITVLWDREAGFSAIPDTRRLRQLSIPVHLPEPADGDEGSSKGLESQADV
jgi:hypothetical protein